MALTRPRTAGYSLVLALSLVAPPAAATDALAQDTTLRAATLVPPEQPRDSSGGPYFYRGPPYGSDAYMNPLAIILNKGYAVSVIESWNRRVFDPYGFRSVGDALAHPLAAIERGGGWWNFIRFEMLPLSYQDQDPKWITNYFGHVFEGGVYYRRLTEWYQAKGLPLPALAAGVTTLAAAVLNEAYEMRGQEIGSAGTVADLYFFDFAGVALFSFESVPRFFAQKLHADVWVGQASVVLPSGELANNSNMLFFKFPWKLVPSSSLFLWTGIGSQAGLAFHRPNGLDITVGLGTDTEQRRVDPVTGEETIRLASAAGLFIDRNGSLLATLHLTEVRHRLLRVNVYPGVLPGLARKFGAWAILSRDMKLSLGITHQWLGAGLGVGR